MSEPRRRIFPGTTVRVRAQFRNPETRELEDVTQPVTIHVLPPGDGAVVSSGEAARDGVGTYSRLYTVADRGTYWARGISSGASPIAVEDSFEVQATRFPA